MMGLTKVLLLPLGVPVQADAILDFVLEIIKAGLTQHIKPREHSEQLLALKDESESSMSDSAFLALPNGQLLRRCANPVPKNVLTRSVSVWG